MSVEQTPECAEQRDLLAGDWAALMRRALPGVPWVPIPNLGREVERFLGAWEIGAVIFTGGNDISSCPLRDETERRVLERCLLDRLPVLGVCRGLQLFQSYFGGPLRPTSEKHQAGRTHGIMVCNSRGSRLLDSSRFAAPSFHRYGVRLEELTEPLEAWAISEDGFVEGLAHREAALIAVQWHPERSLPDPDLAVRLLRSFHDGQI